MLGADFLTTYFMRRVYFSSDSDDLALVRQYGPSEIARQRGAKPGRRGTVAISLREAFEPIGNARGFGGREILFARADAQTHRIEREPGHSHEERQGRRRSADQEPLAKAHNTLRRSAQGEVLPISLKAGGMRRSR